MCAVEAPDEKLKNQYDLGPNDGHLLEERPFLRTYIQVQRHLDTSLPLNATRFCVSFPCLWLLPLFLPGISFALNNYLVTKHQLSKYPATVAAWYQPIRFKARFKVTPPHYYYVVVITLVLLS